MISSGIDSIFFLFKRYGTLHELFGKMILFYKLGRYQENQHQNNPSFLVRQKRKRWLVLLFHSYAVFVVVMEMVVVCHYISCRMLVAIIMYYVWLYGM